MIFLIWLVEEAKKRMKKKRKKHTQNNGWKERERESFESGSITYLVKMCESRLVENILFWTFLLCVRVYCIVYVYYILYSYPYQIGFCFYPITLRALTMNFEKKKYKNYFIMNSSDGKLLWIVKYVSMFYFLYKINNFQSQCLINIKTLAEKNSPNSKGKKTMVN